MAKEATMDDQAAQAKHAKLLAQLAINGCTLILGPEFCVLDKAETLTQSICDFIADKHTDDQELPYIREDGFFYTTENVSNTFIDERIKIFYRDLCTREVPSYYNLIAQLPFKFIISLSPDDLLHKAFNEINKKHKFICFKKGSGLIELQERTTKRDQKPKPGSDNYDKKPITDFNFEPLPTEPLLFNLMGIYEDIHSLVVTHNAFFEFLYSVFPPEEKLKDELKQAISNSTSFLCLGFQYNKWYLKIIFFIIKKIFQKAELEQVNKTAIYISSDTSQQKTIDFYENQFKIVFNPEKTLDFLHEIYTACDQKNLLITGDEQPVHNDTDSSKFKILHLSSAPVSEMSYLNFDREYDKIEKTWERSKYRTNFQLLRKGAATQKMFMDVIGNEDPDLLIIGVHGKKDLTLNFADEKNGEVPFSLNDFMEGIRLLNSQPGSRLKGIIFHCCYSMDFAKEVAEKQSLVSHAIGMEGLIGDNVIPEFIEGFLNAFFKNKDFSYAFNRAIYAMKTSTSDHEDEVRAAVHQPKLFSKK